MIWHGMALDLPLTTIYQMKYSVVDCVSSQDIKTSICG